MNIEQVKNVLVETLGVKVDAQEENLLVVEQEGILVAIILTEEEKQRLRFSVNICQYNDDMNEALPFNLLDLNTEIDPVAVGLNTDNSEDVRIQAVTTLKVVDLQPSEIVAEFEGILGTLPMIAEVIKDSKE